MKYIERSNCAGHILHAIRIMKLCPNLNAEDQARLDQLIDMTDAWYSPQPSLEDLFEHPDKTYEFYEPRFGRVLNDGSATDAQVLLNVRGAFLRQCTHWSRKRSADKDHPMGIVPIYWTGTTDDPLSVTIGMQDYDFEMLITAQPSTEVGLYNISVNVID